MKVLVLGRNGMLGHQVLRVGKELGIDIEGVGRDEFEAETFMKNAFFDFERFAWVINCIGVVKPLSEPLKSISVNALFPNYLARHLKNNYPKTKLLCISTDCVFDGVKGHYDEDSQYSANDLYGMSKALGEVKDMDNTLTIRTSIIGRELNGNKRGLIEWVLSNPDGGSINGYTNHYWSGVTTRELAFRMFQIVGKYPDVHGLKVVASPTINKYDLVSMIVEEFSRDIKVVPHEAKPSIDRGMYQSNSLRDVYRRNGLREQIKELVEDG